MRLGQPGVNTRFASPAAPSEDGHRWVLVAFERCVRPWANPPVPCIHSDPALSDAAPGDHVRVRGRLWFYEGTDPTNEIARMQGS